MNVNYSYSMILALFVLLFSTCSVASPPRSLNKVQVDLKKDFGARGDGKTNDTRAFMAVSKYIKQRGGNCTVNIPKGIYIVGKQIQTSRSFLSGVNILEIIGCQNVKIFGNGATLRFRNGMKYGSFNPSTARPHHSKKQVFADKKYLAACGNMIHISNSRDVEVRNINVDGNSKQAIKGGKFGDTGIQASYTGVNIEQSTHIVVADCNFSHLGLDGILIANRSKDDNRLSQDNKIKIDNCKSSYNGRQGLSWVGGNGIEILNSEFTYTGHGKFSTSPGAGIDIEYEGNEVKNGIIKNCFIYNNKGVGVVSDRGQCKNVLIKDCFIWGVSNYSTWIRNRNFTFDGCTIYGTSVHGYGTTNKSDATKFINCAFRDTTNAYGSYMINNDGVQSIFYENCSFYPIKKRACYVASRVQLNRNLPLFKACKFYFKKKSLKADNDYWMVWRGVQYGNCSFYYDTPKKSMGRRYISNTRLIDLGENRHVYNQKF